ncbi:TetR/AcrR family transcriptional regulator [Colwellia hornerae]|uniref:TetR/AcrR family transcriptional regulator n=1 Tax=Colwellia hornerae TaxID=89402 RepID=A0A5C6QCD0_9GAMM|nr:TetR/AcrR family transcriptional regulator [Colwellia hornerae]TWX58514.1 TetR/AcrR family transcriptional regulator [Colwellia hornerae]TWX58750.1 TetR/AcrR family transcriptional regulator [Colwellia hornerae]TWX66626.1 TetR/AcrR family transcriptional regulator [Colwellia hornerae]
MAPAPKFSLEEQEKLILFAAVAAIEKSNLLDFSMSSIAKSAGLSMGSVYKFVQCKEDLLIVLATKMYQEKHRVFSQVLALPLTTPERIIALSLLDFSKVQMFSFDDQLESIVNTRSIIKRCSQRWLDYMINCSRVCEDSFKVLLQTAVDTNELQSDVNDMEQINIGAWSLTVGYFQTVRLHHDRNSKQDNESQACIASLSTDNVHILNLQRFINTFNWRQKVSKEDLEKIVQQLTTSELR